MRGAELGDDVHGRRPTTASMSEMVEIVGNDAGDAEAGPVEQRVELPLGAFAAADEDHHVEVEGLREVGRVARGNHTLQQEQGRARSACGGGRWSGSRRPAHRRSRGSPAASRRDHRRWGGVEERPGLDPAAGEEPSRAQVLLGALTSASRSSRTPLADGDASSIDARSCPCPPPMSTIVENGVKSYTALTVGQSRADRRVMALLNVAANSGFVVEVAPTWACRRPSRRRACRSRPSRPGGPRVAGSPGRRASG